MERLFKIRSSKLLAVEGKDECNFFASLLAWEGIDGVQLIDIGGKDKFQIELPLLMRLDGFETVESIGFIRDAETRSAGFAFESICNVLKKNKLPVPVPFEKPAIQKPRTGIFIMPDNEHPGSLEDLCLKSLEFQPIKSCIDDYIACLLKEMHQHDKNRYLKSKSEVLCYLASRVPIVNSLGLAAQHHFWKFSHDSFNHIKRFLHEMFE